MGKNKKKRSRERSLERKKAAAATNPEENEQEKQTKNPDIGECDTASSSPPAKKAALNETNTTSTNAPPPPIINSKLAFESITPTLSPGILSTIRSPPFCFTQMTPVQSSVIPLFLRNKDVCVQAVTGSGKTLSFLIPMIEMLLRKETPLSKNEVGGLVISPTRELAIQTHSVCVKLCLGVNMTKPLLLVGGSNKSVLDDLKHFHELHSDIIVATPGRLEDVLSRYDNINVKSGFECLVLDEADVLLDMGFEMTLSSILRKLPKMRRTGLFSATQTKGVKMLGRAGLRNPVLVNVAIARAPPAGEKAGQKNAPADREKMAITKAAAAAEQATPTSLTNYHLVCPLEEKMSRLVSFLIQHKDEKVVVFFLTCACVEFFSGALQQVVPEMMTKQGEKDSKYYIEPLHGKLVQKRREKALERFRSSSFGTLFCTDVAARGLDVTDIQWVVQFDAPPDPSSFVHRVGRCARAGRTGQSLIMMSSKENAYIDFLKMKKVPLQPLGDDKFCVPPSEDDSSDDDDDDKMEEDATEETKPEPKEDESKETDTVRKIQSANGELITDVLPLIRNKVLQDRDLLEKGTKAFTSYIRAYKEHQCAFIFRFKSLDLGHLATSFCLLRLPKMPELKPHLTKINFTPAGPEVDIYGIRFKDKVREKARQKRLAAELAAGGKNAKQIKAEQRAAEKIRWQKQKRADAIAKGRKPDKKRGRQQQIFDEWDDLAKEERLHKKLRSGKISKAEYKKLMYGDGKEDEGVANGSDVEE